MYQGNRNRFGGTLKESHWSVNKEQLGSYATWVESHTHTLDHLLKF